jgi:hypothetical protein
VNEMITQLYQFSTRSEVTTSMVLKTQVFWIMMPCVTGKQLRTFGRIVKSYHSVSSSPWPTVTSFI